mgnify:CR=1 FL=1
MFHIQIERWKLGTPELFGWVISPGVFLLIFYLLGGWEGKEQYIVATTGSAMLTLGIMGTYSLVIDSMFFPKPSRFLIALFYALFVTLLVFAVFLFLYALPARSPSF